MELPAYIHPEFLKIFPSTMTILVTYGCTAACEQCCFESNPSIKHRLSLSQIKESIDAAKVAFPALKLVVFSGGEAFMLKDDLYEAVRYATSLNLKTRIVSNGYWAKNKERAKEIMATLHGFGLSELNLSTGLDHQKWVNESTVFNAAEASLSLGVSTLVTLELDSSESNCLENFISNERYKPMNKNEKFSLINNSWMNFQENAEERQQLSEMSFNSLRGGCSQVFDNLVVTPHNNLSACCGLTLEHIPEIRLGSLNDSKLWDLYAAQLEDFLKVWIHMDGPFTIMEKLLGKDGMQYIGEVRHICEACAIMHKNPKVITALTENYEKFVPDVLSRLSAKVSLSNFERTIVQQGLPS